MYGGILAQGSRLFSSSQGRSDGQTPKHSQPPTLLSSPSPHAPVQPFAAGPAGRAGGRGIAEQGGADLLFIGPVLDFEAARLLLTASINHPETVPLWV